MKDEDTGHKILSNIPILNNIILRKIILVKKKILEKKILKNFIPVKMSCTIQFKKTLKLGKEKILIIIAEDHNSMKKFPYI